jgi:UPF0176 protein
VEAPILITAFYKFLPLAAVEELHAKLQDFGTEHGMRGLVLLAEEGVNGTVCGTPEVITEWKALLHELFGAIECKDSTADRLVFKRWSVQIRDEIVAIKQPDVQPRGVHKHLTPEEWHATLEKEDVIVLDTRNTYETDIGVFEKAMDPRIKNFQEFPEYVKKANLPKEKKILMYCTGGIRCEKALLEMEKQGYEHVYQLQGGILAYLEKFPHGKFQGECFVFDHRVAVNQELKPSARYSLCPHCGDPGDVHVACVRCATECVICARCQQHDACRTCSKECKNKLLPKRIAVC